MYRIAMGGDYEGGLTPAQRALWEGYLPYMGNCYCTFALLCSTDFDERDCPCRKELDNCPVQISYQPGRVGHNSDSCIT